MMRWMLPTLKLHSNISWTFLAHGGEYTGVRAFVDPPHDAANHEQHVEQRESFFVIAFPPWSACHPSKSLLQIGGFGHEEWLLWRRVS